MKIRDWPREKREYREQKLGLAEGAKCIETEEDCALERALISSRSLFSFIHSCFLQVQDVDLTW